MNIAIDGPAGAGKSTIAKLIARKLGYIYVDTGAMYRALGYYALDMKLDLNDQQAVSEACARADVSIRYMDGEQRVYLNDVDVTDSLRREEVGNAASIVAKIPSVRVTLTGLQRKLASENNVVMDGRDIGTAVLPDAELKIYLTASSRVRAIRRYEELKGKGIEADPETIEKDIIDRDYEDMHRDISPLVMADDAVLIDSSEMNIEEVTDRIIELIGKTQ